MKLSQSTIQELGIILKEEYNLKLNSKKLNEFAYFLINFFSAFQKFENHPIRSIDNDKSKVDYKKEK